VAELVNRLGARAPCDEVWSSVQSREREDGDASAGIGFAEHKVQRARIKIHVGDPEEALPVQPSRCREVVENAGRPVLAPARIPSILG
jgi:hypothetical protein